MPSRVITARISSGSNTDKKGGTYAGFTVLSDSGPVSNASVISATLSISSYKTYSASFYLNVIYGGNGGTVVAKTGNLSSNSSVHSSTEELSGLSAELLTGSVITLTLGVVSTSGTGNKINLRDGCTLTLTVSYQLNTTPCSAPTSVSVSPATVDAGLTAALSWSGAKAGINNPIANYVIYRSTAAGSGYAQLQTVSAGTSSVSVTAHSSMGAVYYYKVAVKDTASGAVVQSGVYASLTSRTYTACAAPAQVSVSQTNVAPGAKVTLAWSGAKAGTNNPITGYQIYRAESAGGPFSLLNSVTGSAASGSVSVTAPTGNGAVFYYKVATVGTKSGYNSGQSSASAALACVYSPPSAPSVVTIGGGAAAYALPGASVTLAWSGAKDGTNNAVTGYDLYQNGVLYAQALAASAASHAVAAHATAGGSFSYTVVARGAYSNSPASAAAAVYTYSHPAAPASVSVSNNTPDAGSASVLSWSGAAGGSFNTVTGFKVYRAVSADGTYILLTTVTGDAPSGSCTVTAPAEMGSSYYYKVETIGERSGSGLSSAWAAVTAQTYTVCTAPETVTLSALTAAPGEKAVLSWSAGTDGIHNPVSGYAVYRKSGDGGFELLEAAGASQRSLQVTAPHTPGGSYTYYVIALGTKTGYDSEASATVTLSAYAYTACKAPNSVTLPAAVAEGGLTLSWSGAAAGTANPITGYLIRFQDSVDGAAWGPLAGAATVAASESYGFQTVYPPNERGQYRRFTVQTLGTVSGFDSEARVSPALRKNRLPPMPEFITGSVTYQQSPILWIHLGPEPDGQSQTLMLSTDGQDYLPAQEKTRLQNLAIGGHMIRAYSLDALGAASGIAEHPLEVLDSGFTDPKIVPMETLVKAVHIHELREHIEASRQYYGLKPYAWSAAPVAGETSLASWREHVLELREAAGDIYTALNRDVPKWTALPVNAPKAEAIIQLREAALAL